VTDRSLARRALQGSDFLQREGMGGFVEPGHFDNGNFLRIANELTQSRGQIDVGLRLTDEAHAKAGECKTRTPEAGIRIFRLDHFVVSPDLVVVIPDLALPIFHTVSAAEFCALSRYLVEIAQAHQRRLLAGCQEREQALLCRGEIGDGLLTCAANCG